MILKMLARHSPVAIGTTLNYINREEAFSIGGISNGISHNLRLPSKVTLADIENKFLEQESYRQQNRRGRIFCYHTIISLRGTGLSQKDADAIARKYFELRGDIVGYSIPHFDTNNHHIHILESSGFYRQDKSSSLRKKDLAQLKLNLEQFIRMKFPYIQSDVEHQGKSGLSQQAYDIAHKGQTEKQRIKAIVEECLKASTTRSEFTSNLQKHDLLHYERSKNKGEITGILTSSGKKYRFRTLAIPQEEVNKLERSKEQEREQQLLEKLENIRNKQKQQNKNREHEH